VNPKLLIATFLLAQGLSPLSVPSQDSDTLTEIIEETTVEGTTVEGTTLIPQPKVTGNLYTNPFYGFSVRLPNEDWQYRTPGIPPSLGGNLR
jgi:hypothetical protein